MTQHLVVVMGITLVKLNCNPVVLCNGLIFCRWITVNHGLHIGCNSIFVLCLDIFIAADLFKDHQRVMGHRQNKGLNELFKRFFLECKTSVDSKSIRSLFP